METNTNDTDVNETNGLNRTMQYGNPKNCVF